MATKDPLLLKLNTDVVRLSKVVAVLLRRIQLIEKENARLKGSIGRANNQISTVERSMPKGT